MPLKRIEPDALERLKRYRWPGNIRELENLTRRLAALYPQEAITAQLVDMELNVDAPEIVPGFVAAPNARNTRPAEPERRQTLASAMERHLSEISMPMARACHRPNSTTGSCERWNIR